MSNFPSVSALILHYRLNHKFNANSSYRCRENNCLRDFPNLKSFRKHINSKHTICLASTEINTLDTNIVSSSSIQTSDNIENDTDVIFDHLDVPNIYQIQNAVKHEALTFIAKLYNTSILPRSYVTLIVENTNNFLGNGFVSILKEFVMKTLENYVSDETTISQIKNMFEVIENPFKGLTSEYLCFKEFERSGYLIPPINYTIGRTMEEQKCNGYVTYKSVDVTAQFIPLRQVFKNVLEMKNMLHFKNKTK